MIEFEDQKQVFALSLITILGGMTFFQAGMLSAGNLGLLDQDSGKVMGKEDVREKVHNYVSVTSGDMANASITSIERSDKIESFYKVGVELTAKVMNETQTQQTTVFVSRDGEYILSGRPRELDNPQPPRPTVRTSSSTEGIENRTQ